MCFGVDNQRKKKIMRKFIMTALVASSLLAVASAANAGYWWNGIYYPTCFWNAWGDYVCY
jgi:hypothetical protein